jgi:hypothetical protein
MGSTALVAKPSEQLIAQLSDGPGRLSRAVPLLIAEHLHLATNAIGLALIPWMQGLGFALFGKPYNDGEFCKIVGQGENPPSYALRCILDTILPVWKFNLCLLRLSDNSRMDEVTIEFSADEPGLAMEQIIVAVEKILIKHAGIHSVRLPAWYQLPTGSAKSDYLLRLEQQLAVMCINMDFLEGGGLSGEHEILDGTLQLCLRQPKNHVVRMILAQTALQMKKACPEIVNAYKNKLNLLNREYPLTGSAATLIQTAIATLDK